MNYKTGENLIINKMTKDIAMTIRLADSDSELITWLTDFFGIDRDDENLYNFVEILIREAYNFKPTT